jgi:hypothetical protein
VRTLHLVDIENLCAGVVTDSTVRAAWARFLLAAQVAPGDHVVVGSGPRAALTAWFALPGSVRRVLGRGATGGEDALIDSVNAEDVALRYDRVVVGSGDHRFVPLVRRLRLLGVRVHLAAPAACTSRSLVEVAA